MAAFELDLMDFLNFKKMMKKNPRLFSNAAVNVLNSHAFGTRKLALRNINRGMIVRNQAFVKSSMRVDKARKRFPFTGAQSEVGSIKRDRFTGWEEQETGKADRRKHYAKETARSNSRQKRVGKGFRLNQTSKFPQPSDFKGKVLAARANKMLHVLSRAGFTKPFLLKGFKSRGGRMLPAGVWKFGRGKHPNKRLILLQRFKPPKKGKITKWMSKAAAEYGSRVNLRTLWGRAIGRELKRLGR